MRKIVIDLIGMGGFGCLIAGVFQISAPAAFIVGGASLMIGAAYVTVRDK